MRAHQEPPDLWAIAAGQLAESVLQASKGSEVGDPSLHGLEDTLELLVPQVLGAKYPAWERESIDGFNFSSPPRSSGNSLCVFGTCILISDQTVTPFLLELVLSSDRSTIRSLKIRVGEPGVGELGISGPNCRSRGAARALATLDTRIDTVHWVYQEDLVRERG